MPLHTITIKDIEFNLKHINKIVLLKKIAFFIITCVSILGINSCGNNQQMNEIINDFENLSIIGHIDSSSGNEITVCDRHNIDQIKVFPIDNLVDEIQLIQLDSSNEDNYISEGFVTVSDNYIGVKTSTGYKLFNKTGRFISDIGRKGPGPEEYPFPIYDAKISESRNSIFLLPMGNGVSYIIEYDLDGNFKSRIPLAYPINKGRMFYSDDEFTIYSLRWDNEYEPAIWTQNRKGEVLNEIYSKITTTNPDFSNEIYVGTDSVASTANIFTFNFSLPIDTLYHIEKGNIIPQLTIEDEKVSPHLMVELKDYYLIQFFTKENVMDAITFSPNSIIMMDKKSLKGGYIDFIIESLGGLLFKGYISEFSSGYFILNLEPGDLGVLIDESIKSNPDITPQQKTKLKGIMENIDMDGNNVIIYGKFI